MHDRNVRITTLDLVPVINMIDLIGYIGQSKEQPQVAHLELLAEIPTLPIMVS
jgi:hypothetical protein